MTAQATRDALAEMDGWKYEPSEDQADPAWWRWNAHPTLKSRTWCKGHPHPPTLDGADAAIPEGWKWSRDTGDYWRAWTGWETSVEVPDTGDKIADLYALALACRKAMEVNNGK